MSGCQVSGLYDFLKKLYIEFLSKPRIQVAFLCKQKSIVINKPKKKELERIK